MSGYQDCACRDCFDIAIGDGEPTLCNDCKSAGCEAYPGYPYPRGSLSRSFYCQRADAYGVDGLEDNEEDSNG